MATASLSIIRTRPWLTAAALTGSALLAIIFPKARDSYRLYIAIGPGGIPHNVFGWAVQGLLQPLARHDTISAAPFSVQRETIKHGPHSRESFLAGASPGVQEGAEGAGSLPVRDGDRPTVPGYVAPQRQITDEANGAIKARMQLFLRGVVEANPTILALRPSGLEGAGTFAIFFAPESGEEDQGTEQAKAATEMPLVVRRTKGELCHIHGEGSTHMILSLADAEEAVRKGWAQRHPFSGVMGFWPLTYVMVYAPRDYAELEIWKKLVGASVRFVCAGAAEVTVDESAIVA